VSVKLDYSAKEKCGGLPRDAWHRVGGVVSHGIPRLILAVFGIVYCCQNERRQDARHRSASIVLCGVLRLVLALFGFM
jgi:hypothetical protein